MALSMSTAFRKVYARDKKLPAAPSSTPPSPTHTSTAAALAAAALAASLTGAALAVREAHTPMRRLLLLVFSRAQRHCRRFARWYVAAVAGSIVYRAYMFCALTTDSRRLPLAGAIRGQPVALAHSVLRRGQLRGEPLEAVPASGRNESVQVVIVGAGVSGLVAAWELRKRGVTDVLVLEMDDAPGGNARSGYDGPGGIAYPWG